MRKADLRDADFTGADLSGAEFTGAKNPSTVDLKGAVRRGTRGLSPYR
ncbi:pentapeptide repeat-containing protein [Streptomyces sp. NPDC094149]